MDKKSVTLILPILPGKTESWRRFCQQLQGSRKDRYAAWRRRMGIDREQLWLSRTPGGQMAVARVNAADWEKAVRELSRSENPFARWLKDRIRDIHGIDLDGGQGLPAGELMLEWEGDEYT